MSELELRAFSEMAIAHYGTGPQATKAAEELTELLEVILQWHEVGLAAVRARLVDEIADVTIMAAQLRVIAGPADVDERIAFKVRRQLDRMERGE